MKFSDAIIAQVKARHAVDEVAGQWVRLRRKRGGEFTHAGPCPLCSRSGEKRDDARFECSADKWVCAACCQGGDVIKLVMLREGIDFCAAVNRLGGDAAETIAPRHAERRGRDCAAAGKPRNPIPGDLAPHPELAAAFLRGFDRETARQAAAACYRERERLRLAHFWDEAAPFAGTPVQAYLRRRGLLVPSNAQLRFHPWVPYFADGRENEPRLIHRGPAMLAAFWGAAGVFTGLHITWLDLATAMGKALIADPETGLLLPAKKMRGSKAGSYIDLGGDAAAERMVAGEGIETVLSVATALFRAGRDLKRMQFRAAGDLGNLGGRARESVRHPTLKDAAGRARRVPGPDPDQEAPAMPVPDGVRESILLGDGDSDPFVTRCAMARAAQRHARPGRNVRVIFAPPGCDFNDVLRGRAPEPCGDDAGNAKAHADQNPTPPR